MGVPPGGHSPPPRKFLNLEAVKCVSEFLGKLVDVDMLL